MPVSVPKFNTFTFFKLPSAWWCGVRLQSLDKKQSVVTVKLGWFNQNPFKSMFWAVQGMAAELTTGAMMIDQIKDSGKKISMLVANNNANFSKKATGKITFVCSDGDKNKGGTRYNYCHRRGANGLDAICRNQYGWSSGIDF